MQDKIIIKGARGHNLKNISLEIPKNKLVVFTGVSGSGKSSLAFDTIFAEGQRRYIESLPPTRASFWGRWTGPMWRNYWPLADHRHRSARSLAQPPFNRRHSYGNLRLPARPLRALGEVHCPKCGGRIRKLSLEEMVDIIIDKAKELKEKTVTILAPVVRGRKGEYYQLLYNFLSLGFGEARIDGKTHNLHEKIILPRYKIHTIEIIIDKILVKDESRLFEAVESALHHSKSLVTAKFNACDMSLSSNWTCPKDNFSFPEVEPRLFSFNSPYGTCQTCGGLGKTDLFLDVVCPDCRGKRLKPEALSVKIHDKNISEVSATAIDEAYLFFGESEEKMSKREKQIASNVIKEIKDRLNFLLEVGLDYLTMEREAETLSGGEAQRMRLASQIGSKLSGTLYVLDEPTIGLHERDTTRLIKTLKSLRDQNNTVILVEHDETTILSSDFLVDLGPGTGKNGGEVVVIGETEKLMKSAAKSLTLDYLKNRKKIEIPARRKK